MKVGPALYTKDPARRGQVVRGLWDVVVRVGRLSGQERAAQFDQWDPATDEPTAVHQALAEALPGMTVVLRCTYTLRGRYVNRRVVAVEVVT